MSGKSFGFNASAVAFGGLIKPRGAKQTKPIKGRSQPPSVALSPAGGLLESYLGNYNDDGIKFKNARTLVEGKVDGSVYLTTAMTSLESLDVFGIVTADGITSTIESERDIEGDDDAAFRITASFTNLRIDGKRVSPALDLKLFREIPTYRDFLRFFSDPKKVKEIGGGAWGWRMAGEGSAAEMFKGAAAALIASPEPVRCSLVTKPIATAFEQDGYSLALPDQLGTLHIAEVLVKPALRRINMLRLEIRKRDQGLRPRPRPGSGTKSRTALAARAGDETYNATICSGEGNGSESIPP